MNDTISKLKAELAELEPKVTESWEVYKAELDKAKPLEKEWTCLLIKEQGLKSAIAELERLEQPEQK